MSEFHFKAAVLEKTGHPLKMFDRIPVPALKPGQLLVKMAYSGVCRSQLMEARGLRGKDHYLPHLLGHEGSGKVIAVGSEVTKVKPGDFVILGWIKGLGLESGGTQFHVDGQIINAGGITTFSDYTVISENRCVKIPAGLPLDIAVLFGCALPTGAGIVLNEIELKPQDTVVVWGLGGIGLSALMATQLFGCKQVIAVDVEDSKLALAREFGATHTINSTQENAVEKIRALTNDQGADYAIEASGFAKSIEQAFEAVKRNGGLCIFASHPANHEKIELDPFELICGKQIRGSWGGGVKPDTDIPRMAELYLKGKLPLQKLLSKPYALNEINQALDDLENRKVTRAIIEIDPTLKAIP